MRITNRNARMDSAGRHNDRNFDVDKAPHINQDRTFENRYYTYNDEKVENMTLREIELEYYTNHFENALEHKNEKHKEQEHPNRTKTIEQYYTNRRTMPEDKILQIGDINEHATGEELWECALEYRQRFEEIYGDNCRILDMSLHMDEATPHVHVRRVWFVEDERGNEYVNQEKALEQLGIERPDINKPKGRYNNAKMTLTQTDIYLFQTICIEHGLDIDMDKPRGRQVHLDTKEFTTVTKVKEYDRIEQSVNALARFIKDNPYLVNAYEDKLKEAEDKSLSKRNEVLVQVMIDAYEALHGQIDIADKYERLKEYVEEHGLMDNYDEWEEFNYPEEKSTKTREQELQDHDQSI